jgi:hypothetical protein
MTRQQKNRIRAMVLLMVFSLNTIAGFACSLGVDMGYNTKHHDHPQSGHEAKHSHSHSHKHSHVHKPVAGAKLKAAKDDCCSGQVNDFNKLEKSVPHNDFLLQAPSSEISTDLFNLLANDVAIGPTVNSRFQFVRRSCFLNDTDLLTAISRFRI